MPHPQKRATQSRFDNGVHHRQSMIHFPTPQFTSPAEDMAIDRGGESKVSELTTKDNNNTTDCNGLTKLHGH